MKSRRLLFPVLFVLIFTIAGIFYFYQNKQIWTLYLHNSLQSLEELVKHHPVFAVFTVAFLPMIGFPISPLYLLCGAAYGFSKSLVLVSCGILLNMLVTYFLSKNLFRDLFLKKILKKHPAFLSSLNSFKLWKIICIIRLIRFIPISFQNYILGVLAIPFKYYITLSFPIEVAIAAFFISTGNALMHSSWLGLIIGLISIAALIFIAKIVYKRFLSPPHPTPINPNPEENNPWKD